mgnify:CR=1 FL=1
MATARDDETGRKTTEPFFQINADLVAGNIAQGINIFGVDGNLAPGGSTYYAVTDSQAALLQMTINVNPATGESLGEVAMNATASADAAVEAAAAAFPAWAATPVGERCQVGAGPPQDPRATHDLEGGRRLVGLHRLEPLLAHALGFVVSLRTAHRLFALFSWHAWR